MTATSKPDPKRRRLTPELFKDLVDQFRRTPGDTNAVARACGIDKRTALKAWATGLPYDFARRPVRDLLADEKVATRAALEEGQPLPPATKALARADAVRSRTDEALVVRGARKNAMALMAMTGTLTRAGVELAAAVKDQIKAAGSGELSKSVRLMRDIARMALDANTAAKATIEMERRLLGEEGPDIAEDMTPEEAVRVLEESTRALTEAKRKWGTAAVTGGT